MTPDEIRQRQRDRIRTLEAQVRALERHRGELEELVAAMCILASRTINGDPHLVLGAAIEYVSAERERMQAMTERVQLALEVIE